MAILENMATSFWYVEAKCRGGYEEVCVRVLFLRGCEVSIPGVGWGWGVGGREGNQ